MVVFDLDETLTHCVTDNPAGADRVVTIPLATGEAVRVLSDFDNSDRLALTSDRTRLRR